jgi:hypothetical protein
MTDSPDMMQPLMKSRKIARNDGLSGNILADCANAKRSTCINEGSSDLLTNW